MDFRGENRALLDEFEKYLRSKPSMRGLGIGKFTVGLYRRDVERFFGYFGNQIGPDDLHQLRVVDYLSSQVYAESTVNRNLVSIGKFFDFLGTKGLDVFFDRAFVSGNVATRPLECVRAAEERDFEKLVKGVEGFYRKNDFVCSYLRSRDVLTATLMFRGGLSGGSIVGLDADDFELNGREGKVKLQRNEKRFALKSLESREVSRYSEKREKFMDRKGVSDSALLLTRMYGKRMCERSVRRKVLEHIRRVGIKDVNTASFFGGRGVGKRTMQELS